MSCELKIQNVGSDTIALAVEDFNGKPIMPPPGKKHEPGGVINTINILPPMKDISMKVDGGVYTMKVISSEKEWWSGLIPCGSSVVKVDGDKKIVTYSDRELVNTYNNNKRLVKVESEPYFTTTNIFIILSLLAAVIIIGIYMYKRKK
jgi:hypothetical protein